MWSPVKMGLDSQAVFFRWLHNLLSDHLCAPCCRVTCIFTHKQCEQASRAGSAKSTQPTLTLLNSALGLCDSPHSILGLLREIQPTKTFQLPKGICKNGIELIGSTRRRRRPKVGSESGALPNSMLCRCTAILSWTHCKAVVE